MRRASVDLIETWIPHKQHRLLEKVFRLDPLEFLHQDLRPRKSRIVGQCGRTYYRSIVKLHGILRACGSAGPVLLKPDDCVDELRTRPRFGDALSLAKGDYICCGFLDDTM